jgi:hypothetical protein
MWYIEKRAGLLNEVLSCFKGKAYLDYKNLKNEPLLTDQPVSEMPLRKASGKNEQRINMAQRTAIRQYALFA